jgi:multidrug efflux pump subunit AcrA (membrane-fusion protein)
MSADVKVLIATLPDALSVPVSAVSEYEGKRVVYIVDGRSIERKEVEVGEANEQYLQILDGLAEGESVALDARSRAAADLKASKPQSANGKK